MAAKTILDRADITVSLRIWVVTFTT